MSIYNYAELFERHTGIKMMKQTFHLPIFGDEIDLIADIFDSVCLFDAGKQDKFKGDYFSDYKEIQMDDLKAYEIDCKKKLCVLGNPYLDKVYFQAYYMNVAVDFLQHQFGEYHLYGSTKAPFKGLLLRAKTMNEIYEGPAILMKSIGTKKGLKEVVSEKGVPLQCDYVLFWNYGAAVMPTILSIDTGVFNDDVLFIYEGQFYTYLGKNQKALPASLIISDKTLLFCFLDGQSQRFLLSNIYDVGTHSDLLFKTVTFKTMNSTFTFSFEPHHLRSDSAQARWIFERKEDKRKMIEYLKDLLTKLSNEARRTEEIRIIVEINTYGDLFLGLKRYGYEVTGIYCDNCHSPLPLMEENHTMSDIKCRYCGVVNRVKDHEEEYRNYLRAFSEGVEKGLKELIKAGRISVRNLKE